MSEHGVYFRKQWLREVQDGFKHYVDELNHTLSQQCEKKRKQTL